LLLEHEINVAALKSAEKQGLLSALSLFLHR
jgi:hypothetical protein